MSDLYGGLVATLKKYARETAVCSDSRGLMGTYMAQAAGAIEYLVGRLSNESKSGTREAKLERLLFKARAYVEQRGGRLLEQIDAALASDVHKPGTVSMAGEPFGDPHPLDVPSEDSRGR